MRHRQSQSSVEFHCTLSNASQGESVYCELRSGWRIALRSTPDLSYAGRAVA
jgi:hypothetical protein